MHNQNVALSQRFSQSASVFVAVQMNGQPVRSHCKLGIHNLYVPDENPAMGLCIELRFLCRRDYRRPFWRIFVATTKHVIIRPVFGACASSGLRCSGRRFRTSRVPGGPV
jgi:hypothetical protein